MGGVASGASGVVDAALAGRDSLISCVGGRVSARLPLSEWSIGSSVRSVIAALSLSTPQAQYWISPKYRRADSSRSMGFASAKAATLAAVRYDWQPDVRPVRRLPTIVQDVQ